MGVEAMQGGGVEEINLGQNNRKLKDFGNFYKGAISMQFSHFRRTCS